MLLINSNDISLKSYTHVGLKNWTVNRAAILSRYVITVVCTYKSKLLQIFILPINNYFQMVLTFHWNIPFESLTIIIVSAGKVSNMEHEEMISRKRREHLCFARKKSKNYERFLERVFWQKQLRMTLQGCLQNFLLHISVVAIVTNRWSCPLRRENIPFRQFCV